VKVVLDATTLDGLPSGAATRLAGLGAALAARTDVTTLYLVRPGLDPLPGLPCHPWSDTHSPWGRLRVGPRLDTLLRQQGADLFHAAALPLARVGATPQLLTLHDLRFLHPGAHTSLARRLWARYLLGANLKRAARLVAVSQSTAAELRSRGLAGPDALSVVPNAPTPGLAPVTDTDALAAFRRRAGLNCRYLLTIGPLAGHKRVGQALELLAELRAGTQGSVGEGSDLALVLAGRADPETALTVTRRAERLGLAPAVRLVGVLADDELAAALCGAEALLSLGRSEGFAIPVVDAQTLGVPVVAVSAGALPEVGGDAAWMVAPDDRAALAAAVCEAVRPGPEREARLSRGRALAARWSWEASAEALVQCWRATLERAGSSG